MLLWQLLAWVPEDPKSLFMLGVAVGLGMGFCSAYLWLWRRGHARELDREDTLQRKMREFGVGELRPEDVKLAVELVRSQERWRGNSEGRKHGTTGQT